VEETMCRNIKMLFNFDPPATREEIRAAAEQYVRKVSGFSKPSAVNQPVFDRAVSSISRATSDLLDALETNAAPRNRDIVAARAHDNAVKRFGTR
jgi:hypothetical protein